MTRVYLPASPGLVREWLTARAVPEGTTGWAVTAEVESAMPDSDLEEQEYAVLLTAAEASIDLLEATDPPRRMVLVVEGDVASAGDDEGWVRLTRDVRWRAVASLHVDGSDAEQLVQAAREVVTDEIRDALDQHDLEWFAVQEIPAAVSATAGGDV